MTYIEYIKRTTRKERMDGFRRRIIRFVLLMTTVCVLAVFLMIREARGDVNLPETTPDANTQTLYSRGEGAYAVVSEAREARLYIGGDNGEALSVVDASAIRGEMYRVVKPTEIHYDRSDNVIQTGNDSFTWSDTKAAYEGGKSWLRIIAKDGGRIDRVDFKYNCDSVSGGLGASVRVLSKPYGNSYEFELSLMNASTWTVSITNIVAYRMDESTRGNKTDAVLNRYTIFDTCGHFDLGNLRKQYNSKIDKAAGYRWSEWPASNLVQLAGHPLCFDTNRLFFAKSVRGQFGLYAGGGRFMSVEASTDESKYSNVTGLVFTDIDTHVNATDGSEDSVTLKFKVTHSGAIDEKALIILTCDELGNTDGTFYEIPYTKQSATTVAGGTEYTVVVQKRAGADKGFYKVAYGTVAATALVQFNSPVQFNNGLRIRGDDGKIYRISVKNGTVSAAVVTD